MDLLEVLFSNNVTKTEDKSENVQDEHLIDEGRQANKITPQPLTGKQLPVYMPAIRRNDRGKFTILEEGERILDKEEIMEYNFTQDALKRLFADGFVTMPLSKLFLFMHTWAENPGCSPAEYNRILGEQRLVEETIHNTIGFLRDNIQQWMSLTEVPHTDRIGVNHGFVEILQTISYSEQANGRANRASRRERRFEPTLILLCLSTNTYCMTQIKEPLPIEQFIEIVNDRVAPGCTVIVKDRFLNKMGDEEVIKKLKSLPMENGVFISTISEKWLDLSNEERERQYIKTEIEQCISTGHDNYQFEYVWRRIFYDKPTFNGLLTILREIYELKGDNTRPPVDEESIKC